VILCWVNCVLQIIAGLGLSKPIALLMKEGQITIRYRVQSSVLGLVFYTTDVPINYQPIFIFRKEFQKKKRSRPLIVQ
jgi:hypothetical protein